MHLLPGCQAGGRILHIKEFIQGDMEQFAQCRDQIDVRPGSAVLPVRDGVTGNTERFRHLLLLHACQFTVAADPFTYDGNHSFLNWFLCLHIDDIADA